MAKEVKQYIDTDVYTEAKKRIEHVINTFDHIYISFSGGKDSLVVLRLVEEVYEELGIKKKLNVLFRDEEIIPDDVLDFVKKEYDSGKHNFFYYAVPLKSNKFILGQTMEYIQWDPNRKWLRPKPDFAITLPEGDTRVFDQYSMDEFVTQGVKGKIAIMTGIRADESLIRLQSCLVKKNENYINGTQIANVKLVKPIYDWSQDDVFLYFYKREIEYCGIYDLQILNGDVLRVSTPLHSESAKKFDKIKTLYPKFYEQIIDVFPEMIIQERYWNEFDRSGIIMTYEHSWNGIMKYINDNLEGHERTLAKQRVFQCKTTRDNRLAKGEGLHNFGGYPILYVFEVILAGQFKRAVQPKMNPSAKYFEYEGVEAPV
jgi:predicted phosphoadenosine phosphosulfate sulfurtransferase